MTTVYNKDGLRAEADDDLVSIYIEDNHAASMTTGEFMRIAIALTDADIVAVLPSQDKEYCG